MFNFIILTKIYTLFKFPLARDLSKVYTSYTAYIYHCIKISKEDWRELQEKRVNVANFGIDDMHNLVVEDFIKISIENTISAKTYHKFRSIKVPIDQSLKFS